MLRNAKKPLQMPLAKAQAQSALARAQAARPAPPASNVQKVDGPQKNFPDNIRLVPNHKSTIGVSVGPDGMPQFTEPVSQKKPVASPIKSQSGPMEQVEIDKANKLAATPKTYMPQANKVPNSEIAAMQKAPQPNTLPQSNFMPMAPSSLSGATPMKRGGYVTKNGRLNLGSGRVSTTLKSKKNPNF